NSFSSPLPATMRRCFHDEWRVSDRFLSFLREIGRNVRDLLPILIVVLVFQWFVVGEPMPDVAVRLGGLLMTLLGLTLFVRGLEMSLFPLGENLADGIVRRGSLTILIAFAF